MKITFMGDDYDIRLVESKYTNNRLAIEAYCTDSGERFGVVTTNLANEELKDGEFFVRIHSEGVWAKQLLAAGVFEDTGRTVASGFVDIPVWRRGPKYSEVLEGFC